MAALEDRLNEMQEEIDSLRAHIDEQAEASASLVPDVQYVREIFAPKPISRPLDVHKLAAEAFTSYASYDEVADEYRPGVYL